MTEIIYGNIRDGKLDNLIVDHRDGWFKLIGKYKGEHFTIIRTEEMDPKDLEIESKYFMKYRHKNRILKDPKEREFVFAVMNLTDSMETLVQDVSLRDQVQDLIRHNHGVSLEYLETKFNYKLTSIIEELQSDFIIYETDGKFYTL
ncbi:hypothetical protein HDV06_006827 [Boothiomyces sp. JEL0866]|nr:hypothetical protein HDV06_006827 [Boothiomyces sp. JEL0866]